MALNLSMPEETDLRPRITVFGVGGAGGNAVNNMIAKALEGAEFVVANTDAQALEQSRAPARVQLGLTVTQGLGAGARPTVGAAAAEESIEDIVDHLAGAHMCFITAGMGGGTGTGAAPIIAKAARELGVLTVGVVTKPFQFEGAKRMRQAEQGVEELQRVVDTLIIIPNQNLFRLANEKTTFTEAFSLADDVLYQGVKGVTDLMVRPGIINLDFADIRSVMDEMGKAMMGTGEAEGEDRAVQAAEKAIANPLLDEISLKGAKGVLINITGGTDLTLFELDEAANRIRSEVDPDANIIVGSTLDEAMAGVLRVSVVATGIDAQAVEASPPMAEAKPAPMRADRVVERAADRAADRVSEPVAKAPMPEPTVGAPAPAPAARAPAVEPVVARSFADAQAQDRTRDLAGEAVPSAAPAMAEAAPHPAPQPAAETRPRRPGEPSPEALRRLQAAVNKVPSTMPARVATTTRATPPRAEADQNGRFAINSLIHRMTGSGQRDDHRDSHRDDAPGVAHDAPEEAPERDERLDIPAFLRRQAN